MKRFIPLTLALALVLTIAVLLLTQGQALSQTEVPTETPTETPTQNAREYYYGPDFFCVLDDIGAVLCSGSDEQDIVSNVPSLTGFTSINGGDTYACAYHPVEDFDFCWGSIDRSTGTPESEPTVEPPTSTPETAVEPTTEPTIEPSVEPTLSPTPESTSQPTAEPTPEPTTEPTATPTTEPTAEPTPSTTETVIRSSLLYRICDITSQEAFSYPVSFQDSWISIEPCVLDSGSAYQWLRYQTRLEGTITWSVISNHNVSLVALKAEEGSSDSEIVTSAAGANPSITFSQAIGSPKWIYTIAVIKQTSAPFGSFTLTGSRSSDASSQANTLDSDTPEHTDTISELLNHVGLSETSN